MLQPYTYLIVLFFTVIVCFIASFDKRLQFNKQFGAFIKAATIVAIPFIAWDIWFTAHGVWWFNTNYTTGASLAGLPIEEWIFFFCIPFSCVFTYYCLEKFFKWQAASAFNNLIVFVIIVLCAVVGLLHSTKIYTLVTAVAVICTLIYLHFFVKTDWIGRATLTYIILLPGFFSVNGVLTGTGLQQAIVNYNPAEFLGIRMLTIPVEDMFYGYAQFLLVVYFFKKFKNK